MAAQAQKATGAADRELWLKEMTRIARPVVENLSKQQLKEKMPFETAGKSDERKPVSYLEAWGRTVCGLAPWLELGADNSPEGKTRGEFIAMAQKAMRNAVDPKSKDYMVFGGHHQSLVDAAFMAQGILRAPNKLYRELDRQTQALIVKALKDTRAVKPNESNWLMFASIVEAALLEFTGECDCARLVYGIHRFMEDGWYKGDAVYGDGAEVHVDYYNSLVIQPMLTDVLRVLSKHHWQESQFLDQQLKRHARLAAELERLVSPEGTYPCIGRSITYRFGSFHALSEAALLGILPSSVSAGQVRAALTAVLKRQLQNPDNFDPQGWLRIGFAGSQRAMGEKYINTGSEYMCMAFFVAMGLPQTDAFWTAPYADWTNVKAWAGQKMSADHALRDGKMFLKKSK